MNEQPDDWRSLEELSDTPEYRDFVEGEFPPTAALLPDEGVDRRRFLQIMGASMALAGLTGCRRPVMEILPYSRKPEEIVPGLPTFYATAIPRPGGCFPILVESHEGRPTKIEGNPEHPHSKGKTDTFAQSAILDLYDPDRSQKVLKDGNPSTLADFESAAGNLFNNLAKVRFLIENVSSPALRMLAKELPEASWYVYEPLANEGLDEGTKLAFGKAMTPSYHLGTADVIVSLDADLLGLDDNAVSHIRGFASHRLREVKRVIEDKETKKDKFETIFTMSRLYVAENQLTTTGSMADHRLPVKGSDVAGIALALASAILDKKAGGFDGLAKEIASAKSVPEAQDWIKAAAEDLLAADRSLVVAGPRQPAIVHAIAAVLNDALGNTGNTVVWRERQGWKDAKGLKELASELTKDDTLVILGGNPAYNAPGDIDFQALLKKAKASVHLSLYADETSVHSTWHLPMSHFLEAWGDAEAHDGTYSVIQPLLTPLYGETRSALEFLARRTTKYKSATSYAIVLDSFKLVSKADENAFRKVLHGGFLPDSDSNTATVKFNAKSLEEKAKSESAKKRGGDYELSFHGDYRVYDGRFTNNGWLQETPDPVSKLVWDNAALVAPITAKEMGVQTGDIIRIEAEKRSIEIPVFVQPGQAKDSISVHFGYGRTETGRVSKGSGFDVYPLRMLAQPWFIPSVKVTATGKKYTLASTQNHGNMTENSKFPSVAKRVEELARTWTLAQYATHHEDGGVHSLPLITHPSFDGQYQWAMTIDLNTCVGCNACQLACQAENNVPIVGKGEILRGREMFWIRIDRYYTGSEDNPEVKHQPVACVHCEAAPCETVCPVNAAVHSPEGLNVQVYNRCIGTRYCANNCPYKVRRFNWFDYHQRPLDELRLGPLAPKGKAETLKMQMNPDVTVRMRGVMERCNYCLQRIERAKIDAKVQDPTAALHPLADGAVVPACAQACPAGAITFGDKKNKTHRVNKLKEDRRNYVLLESVGTKPRTSYLLRLKNRNPKLVPPKNDEE